MTTITTIAAGDLITNSRTDINSNFANLNSDKIETSYLDTDNTLAANSDAKIATQKAVKAYVDAGGNVNASETAKGIVEEATAAEVLAQTAAGATGSRLFINPSKISSLFSAPVVNYYTSTSSFLGASNSRFDITNPSGTTFRYTWDGTGTDPGITAANPAPAAAVNVQGVDFAAGNNGSFLVTASGTNYFEVTNASGVAENDKTLNGGYLAIGTAWTKPSLLKYVIVELVGGGASGGGSGTNSTGGGGGGAGGYSRKKILAASLGSTETAVVGAGGAANTAGANNGLTGKLSSFGSHLQATSGSAGIAFGNQGSASGGVGTLGDLNIQGGGGMQDFDSTASGGGTGGSSMLGGGAASITSNDVQGNAGGNYGGGGGGGRRTSVNQSGGAGAQGIVIVTEYYG